MSATVGSTDHPQLESCFQQAFLLYYIPSNRNGGKPIRLRICRTRRLLAAHCAALILPTFFLRVAAWMPFLAP